jgi:hypothetical protein
MDILVVGLLVGYGLPLLLLGAHVALLMSLRRKMPRLGVDLILRAGPWFRGRREG